MAHLRNIFLLMLSVVLAWLAHWGVTSSDASAETALQEEPTAASEEMGTTWVRLKEDDQGTPLALEIAVVRYTRPDLAEQPPENLREYVDLVGAVHIGDARYYQQLNRQFRQYDALLYELVAPEGTVVEQGRGTSNAHPIGAMQNAMKSMLEIDHQLELIDYKRPNFVHADFSPEEFAASMERKGESWIEMYFRLMGQALSQQSEQAAQGKSADVDIFMALFSDDRARQLKIALAKQFESMEMMLSSLSGPDGSTIITERNKRALEVLREQMEAKKKKLGVFYGAGHLTDMHERLVEEFRLVPVGIEWLEAWDLRAR